VIRIQPTGSHKDGVLPGAAWCTGGCFWVTCILGRKAEIAFEYIWGIQYFKEILYIHFYG